MLCRFRIEQSGRGTTQLDWQALDKQLSNWVEAQIFDHHCLPTSPHNADRVNSSQHCFGLWQQSRVSELATYGVPVPFLPAPNLLCSLMSEGTCRAVGSPANLLAVWPVWIYWLFGCFPANLSPSGCCALDQKLQ